MAIDFSKKVAGVPVVYLAFGAAVILGVVAWRMKAAPDVADPADSAGEDAVLDENGLADGSDPYAGLRTNGTVIVQPQTLPAETKDEQGPATNDEWVRQGGAWLVAEKNIPGSTAYTALTKYIDGKSRSVQEAQWIEWVIKEKGYPPEPFIDAPVPITPTPTNPNPGGPSTSDPTIVTGLRVLSVGYDKLVIGWNIVNGAATYRVFLTGKGLIGATAVPGYTITGLKRGTTYKFQVAAVMRSNGKQAQASPYVTGTTAK